MRPYLSVLAGANRILVEFAALSCYRFRVNHAAWVQHNATAMLSLADRIRGRKP